MVVSIEYEPDFRAGEPTVLFSGYFEGPRRNHPTYDVSPDGQTFVFSRAAKGLTDEIHIVTNFDEILRQHFARE